MTIIIIYTNVAKVTGMAEEPIRNVLVNNIRLNYREGGEPLEDPRAYREQGTNYPEPRFAGSTPAYGLYARHVEGLHVSGLTVILSET